MIESKGPTGTLILEDLIIRITSPSNGDGVSAAQVACSGNATPGAAVTVTLFNPGSGDSAAAIIPPGGFMGNTWNTVLPPVDPARFQGPSLLIAQVNPPDGPIAFITVTVRQ
jgi:hypothetical protein